MKTIALVLLLCCIPLYAQEGSPWKALSFLVGTWEANAKGSTGAAALGTYTFQQELAGHIMARHSTKIGCTGPAAFDCGHGDLLYVFEDAPGQPLKAIYFDNEGHVIHYDVSTPDSSTAIFLSDASRPGPQFRLVYEWKNSLMSGKFQMRMPGGAEWKSYLEWNGAKK